jgi:hypothetical protein
MSRITGALSTVGQGLCFPTTQAVKILRQDHYLVTKVVAAVAGLAFSPFYLVGAILQAFFGQKGSAAGSSPAAAAPSAGRAAASPTAAAPSAGRAAASTAEGLRTTGLVLSSRACGPEDNKGSDTEELAARRTTGRFAGFQLAQGQEFVSDIAAELTSVQKLRLG